MIIEITFRNWERYTIKYNSDAAVKRYYPLYCALLKELKQQEVIYSYSITIKGDSQL